MHRSGAGRRLRDELRRQRQGAPQDAVQRVYVQSAAGDAGGAIGAAFALWHQLGGDRAFVMDHAYWGPHFSADEIAASHLPSGEREIEDAGCTVEDVPNEAELCRRTADAIAEGKVVGWFQGRMEWGPRALGNRSILCDPRRADMKDILNAKIKRREIVPALRALGARRGTSPTGSRRTTTCRS